MVGTEERQEEKKRVSEPGTEDKVDVCGDINDPIRRSLCRICGIPVVGEAPFCKNHEPPVP